MISTLIQLPRKFVNFRNREPELWISGGRLLLSHVIHSLARSQVSKVLLVASVMISTQLKLLHITIQASRYL